MQRVRSEQSVGGQGGVEVEEEQARKVVAAKQKELIGE